MSRLNWKNILFLVVALVILGRYLYYTLGITEEQRVLQVIDRAQEAVIDKSLVRLVEVVSEDYRDSSGLDRSSILRWLVCISKLRTAWKSSGWELT